MITKRAGRVLGRDSERLLLAALLRLESLKLPALRGRNVHDPIV